MSDPLADPSAAQGAGSSSCGGVCGEGETAPTARDHVGDSESRAGWWRQRQWQLLATCYSLLATGIALEFLGGQDRVAAVAYAGAVVVGAYPSARDAWRALRRFRLTLATLVMVGALGAMLLGLWEEAAMLVAVYSLGGIFENRVVEEARKAVRDVKEMAPRNVLLVQDGIEAMAPIGRVEVGDLIRVRPGERVPLDGTVVQGHSALDESSISGEPLPVDRGPGDSVISGTLNGHGSLVVRVISRVEDSTIAEVIQAVDEARKNKSTLETFGERFSALYTPAMFGLALVVAAVPLVLGLSWSTWVYRALVVLVISCSCGILLSVPVATLSAVTAGVRRGLVIKGGAYLEAASRIDVVALDKTGTLTTGRPEVVAVRSFGGRTPGEVLALAAGVEAGSEHPLARAVLERTRQMGVEYATGTDFEALPGRGASATVSGKRVRGGSIRWAREEHILPRDTGTDLPEAGTTLLVWDASGPVGAICVGDATRPEALTALAELRASRIQRLVMMTGDGDFAAEAVGRELGGLEIVAGLLPTEKAAEVRRLQAEGHRVAFVGDGINDAPALAQADLGVAMGLRGTDIARATCDVVLVEDDLRRLVEVFSLGRRAVRIMRENVAVSVAGVVLLVGLALTGLVGLVPAIALNEGSALAVAANGLRLGRSPRDLRPRQARARGSTRSELPADVGGLQSGSFR